MHQLGSLGFLKANRRPPRLEIAAGAAAGNLPVGAGPRQPYLQVVGAAGREAQIARAELDLAVGQLQGLKHRLGIGGDLLVGRRRLLRAHEPIQLNFVELVQANQAAGVAAVGAGLAAEAGRVGGVFERQLIRRQYLIAVQGGHRHLGGGGEPEVVLGAAEAFLGELGQLARAQQAGAVDQDRRHHLGVALRGVQIEHEADQGTLEARPLAQQGDEAALGNPHRALGFKQTQPLADLPMLLEALLLAGRAPALDLNVVGFAVAIRSFGGGQVGQAQQVLAQAQGEGLFFLLQHCHLLLEPVALLPQLLHLGSGRIGAGPNAQAHLLANPIALGLEVAALFFEIALLLGNQLGPGQVHAHAAPAELLADQLRGIAQQSLIEHGPRGKEAAA